MKAMNKIILTTQGSLKMKKIMLTAMVALLSNTAQAATDNPHPCNVARSCTVITGGKINWNMDGFRTVKNTHYVNVTMVGVPEHVTFSNVLITNSNIDLVIPDTTRLDRVEIKQSKIAKLTVNNGIVNSLFLTNCAKSFGSDDSKKDPKLPFVLTMLNTLVFKSYFDNNLFRVVATGGSVFDETQIKRNDMRGSRLDGVRGNSLVLDGNNLGGSNLVMRRSYKTYFNNNTLKSAVLPNLKNSGIVFSNNW